MPPLAAPQEEKKKKEEEDAKKKEKEAEEDDDEYDTEDVSDSSLSAVGCFVGGDGGWVAVGGGRFAAWRGGSCWQGVLSLHATSRAGDLSTLSIPMRGAMLTLLMTRAPFPPTHIPHLLCCRMMRTRLPRQHSRTMTTRTTRMSCRVSAVFLLLLFGRKGRVLCSLNS